MNMLKHINIAAATFLLMAAGCSDLSDIKDRLDSAESRLDALKTQVDILMGNVETLTKLKEYHTIKAVDFDESKNTYEITLTNGEKLSLYQGSVGFYSPIMTIDDEGYWKMSLTNADGDVIEDTYVLNNGEKVSAVGEKGITPQFRVDDHENWEVSYDEGSTWNDVLNEAGEPVKAVPSDSADTYFSEVKIENGKLVIKMKDEAGSVISLPILGNFYFIIKDENGNKIDDLQFFTVGETKQYTIDQSDIAEVTVLNCPKGFSVVLNDNLLEITAAAGTKSLNADSGRDITFLASSASNPGLFTMEKIQVETSTAPIVVLSTDAEKVGMTSLTFEVKLYNSDSYYYMILPAEEPAPTADVLRVGAKSTEARLNVTGLKADTEYKLYAMSTSGDEAFSNIVTIQAATAKITSYYEAYLAGVDIDIAGEVIDKATTVTFVEGNGEISQNGIFFIKPGIDVTVTSSIKYDKLLIVGDNPSSKNKVTFTGNTRWNANAVVGFKNVEFIDGTEGTGTTILQSNGAGSTILLDSCSLPTPNAGQLIYLGHAATAVKFVSCNILVNKDSKVLVNIKGSVTDFALTNNIIYSPEGSHINYKIIAGVTKTDGTGTPIENLNISKNTLANVFAYTEKSSAEYCVLYSVTNYICKNNLIYLPDYNDARYTWLIKVIPTNKDVLGNVVYKTISSNTRVRYMLEVQEEQAYIPTTTKIADIVTEVNLSKGIIIPASNNGATR